MIPSPVCAFRAALGALAAGIVLSACAGAPPVPPFPGAAFDRAGSLSLALDGLGKARSPAKADLELRGALKALPLEPGDFETTGRKRYEVSVDAPGGSLRVRFYRNLFNGSRFFDFIAAEPGAGVEFQEFNIDSKWPAERLPLRLFSFSCGGKSYGVWACASLGGKPEKDTRLALWSRRGQVFELRDEAGALAGALQEGRWALRGDGNAGEDQILRAVALCAALREISRELE